MSEKPELKPCPFCGSDDISVIGWGVIEEYSARCNTCEANIGDYYETPQEAIGAWNTRHEPTCHFVEGGPSFAYCCDQCGYDTNYYEYFTYCPGCGARVEVVD